MSMFLSAGFRPFFFAAALAACANMLIWILYLSDNLELHSLFSPRYWHLHEMMFGFIGAAIAGFLLTAVPNWTSRPPLKGINLASLVGLWALGRVAVFYSEYTGAYFAAMADLPLFFILCLYLFREISAHGQKRNLPIAMIIFLLGIANLMMHAEAMWGIESATYGYRLAILLVSVLIMVIGGRVIPNFTANWLKQQGSNLRPTLMNRFDIFCIIWSLLGLTWWLLMPENSTTGYWLLAAGILNAIRLSRWQLKAIFSNPILLILQIGYFWLCMGLFTLGLFIIFSIDQPNIPIHILTIGAFSTMILAVMTRASLGHTGRGLTATKLTIAAYICINISVISRILAGYLEAFSTAFLHLSAATWMLCFVLFLIQYTPYFFTARK